MTALGIGAPSARGALSVQNLKRRIPLLLFLLLLVFLSVRAPAFLEPSNILASLVQAAPIAIVSFGLAAVVIGGGDDAVAGGIDLSIPASAALATAIVSDQLTNAGAGIVQAFLLALVAVLVVGVANAVLVTVVGLPSILSTLATYATVVGVIRVVTVNRRINVDHPAILSIRDGNLLGVPTAVVIALVLFAGFAFLMHRTPYGMHVQAVGGSRDAAESSGLKPSRYIASTFLLGAVAAAFASLVLTARGSGMSPGIQDRLMIDMVLATFLGASFSPRNVVTVQGALLGAILVAFMSNGLILMRVDNSWVDGAKGALILIVVASAALQNRRRS